MKIDRLVSIIMVLLDKKRIGAQELADMFEVSPRTIYRDIDVINMAGIPIRGVSGVGGGFEIMQKYKIDKKVFSTADLSVLLMGLSSLSNMVRGDELVHALAKVKSFTPADRAKDIELKVSQINIDLSPWTVKQDIQPYLKIIKVALQESKLLSFEYVAHHGNKTARTAEPYQLVLKSSHWYLQGYCHKRKIFAYLDYLACQTYKYKRKLLRLEIIKNHSWILLIFWKPCKQELKSVFINLSWTGCLIFALMRTFCQTAMRITLSVFRS